MPHVGIDISDDAITFIQYSRPVGNRIITKFGRILLEPNIIEGGDIKDQKSLLNILTDLANLQGFSYAKISIPEEKAYLFETEITNGDLNSISQNIEFKLEENIPLSAADTVFAFDILSGERGRSWNASVSAVPRTYIEHMMDLFRKAGINPIAFETTPRAIARVVSSKEEGDVLVIHAMKRKTGVYIVTQHTVGFTSTIGAGVTESDLDKYTDKIAEESRRVYSYWLGKSDTGQMRIKKVIVVGQEAIHITPILRTKISDILPVDTVNVWDSILNTAEYVPPILKTDSFDYAGAAGLGL